VGEPAAKQTDLVTATDTHIVLVPTAAGPVPTPMPFPFAGRITESCSTTVFIEGLPAAVLGSIAVNEPPHIPETGSFANPPTDQATICAGSPTVWIDGKPAARSGDHALTCNDPVPLPIGTIEAMGTVLFG
jgi:uncharacterized Zn-binding protein involved in type VI secretion